MSFEKEKLKVHFIGIGGIGTSALARYYLQKGEKVSGSDLVASEITEALAKEGAKIFIGAHKKENLPKNVDLVIFSPAIPKDNPELKEAKRLKIQCLSYPQALGKLTKKYFTVAVCGTHGKSTVTAMIGLILTKAGFDPTVILGTKLKQFGNSNCRVGKSNYLVIEADEYKESFLNYWPKIIVLTSLDPDHLDYYKNFKNYVLAFKKFVSHLPKNGYLVANKDDRNIYLTFSNLLKNVCWYSLKEKESEKLKKLLKIPGEHNVSNALAALKVAKILQIPDEISLKVLSLYKGSWRRFEIIKLGKKGYLGKIGSKITLISDYAHHPKEIQVTLKAAREKYPKRKIFCFYQPHQYQRTYYLFENFIKVFREVLEKQWVDKLFITDIYDVAGREKSEIKKEVSSEKLVKEILGKRKLKNRVFYLPMAKILESLKENLSGGEVVIIMGAGDIYNLTKFFQKTPSLWK